MGDDGRKTYDRPSKWERNTSSAVFDYFTAPLLRPSAEALRILAAVICCLHFCVLAYLARQHPYGGYATETDFYHLFAPDAERLLAGQFPQNTFQGPGYPAVLALLAKLTWMTGDLFTVGKWLSVVSAVAIGWLVFVLFARLFGRWVGIGAQLLVIVSGEFPQFSINATTDVFFLLLCLAALVVFTNERWPVRWRIGWTAALTSLAYLTRYNGLFLLVAFLLAIALFNVFQLDWLDWRERRNQALLFLGIFVLVALPWFHFNRKHHGAALYNLNYLNLATRFYGDLVRGQTNQDATRELGERFHSFGEVLRHDPQAVVTQYPGFVFESLKQTITTTLVNRWTAWAAFVGVLLALLRRRSPAVLTVLTAGAGYVLLMALNHWEARYYFFVLTLYAGLAVFAVSELFDLAWEYARLRHRALVLLPPALFAWLWVGSFIEARRNVNDFLAEQPTEVVGACNYLKSVNAGKARIVARKPHLAYLCRGEWIFFPAVKSVAELRTWLQSNPVDYLVIGHRELKERKELKLLADPNNAPPWLQPVWSSTRPLLVLYQPIPAALSGRNE